MYGGLKRGSISERDGASDDGQWWYGVMYLFDSYFLTTNSTNNQTYKQKKKEKSKTPVRRAHGDRSKKEKNIFRLRTLIWAKNEFTFSPEWFDSETDRRNVKTHMRVQPTCRARETNRNFEPAAARGAGWVGQSDEKSSKNWKIWKSRSPLPPGSQILRNLRN